MAGGYVHFDNADSAEWQSWRNLSRLPCLPPSKQAFFGFFGTNRAFFKPKLHKELIGLTNLTARANLQNLHDLGAI
jgi:hypothetical protein